MKIKQILLSNSTVVEKAFPTKIEDVTSIYQLGLDVVEEKERLYKAIRLAPTDMRYNEFVKYRKAWVKEIIELETLYKNVCYAYHNEPLPEVMARKNEFFTVGGVAL